MTPFVYERGEVKRFAASFSSVHRFDDSMMIRFKIPEKKINREAKVTKFSLRCSRKKLTIFRKDSENSQHFTCYPMGVSLRKYINFIISLNDRVGVKSTNERGRRITPVRRSKT